MTKQEADILHEAMEKMLEEYDVSEYDFESKIYEEYSGKGMYGEKTTALVINSFLSLLRAVMTFPELLYDQEEPISINQKTSHFQMDKLGTSIIIY